MAKEVEASSLEEKIRNQEEKIEQLSDDLERTREEKNSLSRFLADNSDKVDLETLRRENETLTKELQIKKDEVKKRGNKISQLIEGLSNSKKEGEGFQRIIADNTNREEKKLRKLAHELSIDPEQIQKATTEQIRVSIASRIEELKNNQKPDN
ncbi:MAG: hypothetical protein NY202_02515 [Mollicutes bacterium UO1]